MTRRLEKVKAWDREYRETLKRAYSFTDEEVKIWQNEYIVQLEGRLAWLRGREDRYRGDVDGIDIEDQLGRILRFIRPQANYPRDATIIDHSFSKKQLGLIYQLLDVIEEEAIPREYINHGRLCDRISKHRKETGWLMRKSRPNN